MPRRPSPPAAAAAAAAERITERRARCDDPDRARMPDDPLGIAEYAVSHLRIRPDELARDLADVVTILEHQPARLDRAWLAALRAREAAGLSYGEFAPVLGLGSRQAVEARQVRLEAAVAGYSKHDGAAEVRSGRRGVRDDRAAGESHAAQLRALAVALVDRSGEMPGEIADGFEVDALTDALTRWPPGSPPPGDGTINALRFLLGDLAAAIPAGAALRAVVDRGVELVGTRTV